MQIQQFKAPPNHPDYFMAVMQFEHDGIFYQAAVCEELMTHDEPTGAYQVLLNSERGTYTFLLSHSEEEEEMDSEEEVHLKADLMNDIEGIAIPFNMPNLPFLEVPKNIIRQELVKMGRVE